MATTDAKSGFRLPWSSDRSTDDGPTDAAATSWPSDAPTGDPSADPSPEAPVADAPSVETIPADVAPVPAPARTAAKKPTKFLADLTKAMQTAAEAERAQILAAFQADAKAFVELIHETSATEAATIKSAADGDIAGIREWSKAEIARIREETEARITGRKADLERELERHAGSIEERIETIQRAVGVFEGEMAAFFERLLAEDDPTAFAAMAENLPEPPKLEDILPEAFDASPSAHAVAVAEPVEVEAVVETEPEAVVEPVEAEPVAETVDAESVADPETTPESEPAAWPTTEEGAWTVPAGEWGGEGAGEPIDRATVMATMEAAAEAVAAAEMAAESANQAETAADVAETAVELLTTRHEEGNDAWPGADFGAAEAEAALAARAESDPLGDGFADRLTSFLGGAKAETDEPVEIRSTQVVVVGLVSVASIASFKRHLGRVAGVQSVGVSSGPDGEFVFTVSHRSDVVFRDVVPTLPGFGARVTGTGDGTVNVTARDPEAEG